MTGTVHIKRDPNLELAMRTLKIVVCVLHFWSVNQWNNNSAIAGLLVHRILMTNNPLHGYSSKFETLNLATLTRTTKLSVLVPPNFDLYLIVFLFEIRRNIYHGCHSAAKKS